MATYKEYQCKRCKYTVFSCPEGHGTVMQGEMYQFMCKQCREIVDVLAFPLGEKAKKIECPECGSDKLLMWNPKTGKCPKCGGEFEETGNGMMVD